MNTDKHFDKEIKLNCSKQSNSSLLPIQEFEKLNENFRKFKDKRKNLQNFKEINNLKSRQVNNMLSVKSNNNSKFGDATSEITVNAKANIDRSLNINIFNTQYKNNKEKLDISSISPLNSPESLVLGDDKFNFPKLEQNDEDANIISTENEFTDAN